MNSVFLCFTQNAVVFTAFFQVNL